MRVWQAKNLIDDTIITFRNLHFLLKSLRRHEVTTGHYQWSLRSFVAPAGTPTGITDQSGVYAPEWLPAEVWR